MRYQGTIKSVELLERVIGTIYQNIGLIWHGWSMLNAQTVCIFPDSCTEIEPNKIMTEGKEVAQWNKV
jgi:hypothetical protein